MIPLACVTQKQRFLNHAEDWSVDVLVPLGIRPALASRRQLFKTLSDEASIQVSQWIREDEPAISVAVGSALRRLATESSIDDAKSFQRWSRRHFVCRDAPIALYAWREVLRRSGEPPGGLYPRVAPPDSIAHAVKHSARLTADEQTSMVENRIRALAPPPGETDIEIGLELPS